MCRVEANPSVMPTIDWEAYKKFLPESDIVDKFKSELEKFKVPYPNDDVTKQIDEQWKTIEKDIEKFCAGQNKHIDA